MYVSGGEGPKYKRFGADKSSLQFTGSFHQKCNFIVKSVTNYFYPI